MVETQTRPLPPSLSSGPTPRDSRARDKNCHPIVPPTEQFGIRSDEALHRLPELIQDRSVSKVCKEQALAKPTSAGGEGFDAEGRG